MPRNVKPASSKPAAGDDGPGDSQALKLIKTLVKDDNDASRLLELYYWTREPGIVELIRAYLDLPERTQRTLSTFLLNGRPRAISSSFDPQGRLILVRAPTRNAQDG